MALQLQIPGSVNVGYVISRQSMIPGAVLVNDNTTTTAATGTLNISVADATDTVAGGVIITGTLS